MTIEKTINNNYSIFKLAEDEWNYTFVADGPLMQATDIHDPRITQHIDLFAKNTFEDHMSYLKTKGCTPHGSCAIISFSYDLPYESALVNRDEILESPKT